MVVVEEVEWEDVLFFFVIRGVVFDTLDCLPPLQGNPREPRNTPRREILHVRPKKIHFPATVITQQRKIRIQG